MLGFASWTRGDKEGGKPSANYECPYCVPVRMLKGSSAGGRKQMKNLYCDGCESRFEVTPAGEVEPLIPTLAPEETTPGRRTCIALEQGRMSFDDPILCRNCQHHQNIIMQLLSAYDPSNDMTNDNGGVEEEEEAARLTQYREDLERRYPLCVTCRGRIQERLRVVEYKVRTRRLAARSSKLERAAVKEQGLGRNYALAAFDVLLVQGLFSAMFALETILIRDTVLLQIMGCPSPLEPFIMDRRTWYTACALITIITMVRNAPTSLLPCSWALFLLLLRVAMINMVADGTAPRATISLGNWSLPPYALLSLACYGLLWLLYGSDRRRKSSTRKSADPTSPSRVNSRSPSMTASRSSLFEPDVISKFASLDTALENLGPQTPLTTRYTDLGGVGRGSSGRISPFSVPNLQVTKKAPTATPKSMTDLRPSIFDGARRVGLESVLEGFSIDEARPRAVSPSPRVGSGSIVDKVVLTLGCVMARIALNEQLALIAVLLILTIGLRDTLWRRLPFFLRIIVNALALGRLFWIVLLFNGQVLADWPTLHERVNGLEYAMDLLIVLTR